MAFEKKPKLAPAPAAESPLDPLEPLEQVMPEATPTTPAPARQTEMQALEQRIREIDARLLEIAQDIEDGKSRVNAAIQSIAALGAPHRPAQAEQNGGGPFTFRDIKPALVPAEFLTDGDPDQAKMQAHCLKCEANGTPIDIPGVQIGRRK